MPYYIPFRHRQRTKSESADVSSNTQQTHQDASMDCENVNEKNLVVMDMDAPLLNISSNPQFNKIKNSQLKKSKSMESLQPPKADDENESKVNSSSSTLEFVSHRIQKLKFNEWSAVLKLINFHFNLQEKKNFFVQLCALSFYLFFKQLLPFYKFKRE